MKNKLEVIPDECALIREFLDPTQSDCYLTRIVEQVSWQQQSIKLFGKKHTMPRLIAWFGDKEAVYTYSGLKNFPLPWFSELIELKECVEAFSQATFNSVLLNYYRDGNDSMGAHSDDEKELGSKPVIVSLSLGATRQFRFHPKSSNSRNSVKISLDHGSLLLMHGNCQDNWKHSLPKTKTAVTPRLNLTFRRIITA